MGKRISCLFFCFFIACGSTSDADSINVHITSMKHKNAMSKKFHRSAMSYCEKLWARYMPVQLKISAHNTEMLTAGMAHYSNPSQRGILWYFNAVYPFRNNNVVWTIFLPNRYYNTSAPSYGLATIGTYRSEYSDFHPIAIAWTVGLPEEKLGDVICHEICHTLGFKHEYGYEFGATAISVMLDHLSSVNKKRIREAKRMYRKTGNIRWKKILRFRRKRFWTR